MEKQRRNFTGQEKVALLRRHLVDKVPVSQVCEKARVQPAQFYTWQKQFFENGAAAFERKQVDLALQAEKAFSDTVIASIPGLFYVINQEGRFVRWNQALQDFLGLSSEQVSQSEVVSLVNQEDREMISRKIGEIFRDGHAEAEARVLARGGSRYVSLIARRMGVEGKMYLVGTGLDITGRRQMEAELELQSAALNSAANAIVITDRAGTIEWVNPSFCSLTGYVPEEALGRNPRDLVKSGLHDQALYQTMWNTILAGQVWQGEIVNRKKDGTLYTEEQTITPVKDESSAIAHFIGIKLDVTKRKEAEQALKMFRALMDGSSDTIHVIDPETGRFLDVNETACLSSGYAREELLALSVFDVDVNLADLSSWLEAMEELRTSGSIMLESRIRRKDGTTFPVEVSASYIQVNHGYVVAVVRDITERKQAEEVLRETRDRLERVARAGNIGLWDWDLRTNQGYYSPECKRQIGYEDHEITFDHDEWQRRLHPDDRRRMIQALDAFIANEEPKYVHQYRFRHKDGSYRWILSQASLEFDEGGRPIYLNGSHVDITEYKQLEEQFQQAQKMESVGQLAGGVAHDFNNLISVILGYANYALQTLPEDSPMRADIQEIYNAGERAAALTRQLLAFSRRQVLQPDVVNLTDLVTEHEKILRRLVREDIDLEVVSPEDLGCVKIDPRQMEQVIMNLVVNARDAMPTGGHLTIEMKNADLDQSYTNGHMMVRPGSYVLLAVTDTGEGMDEATVARVFEPFFTTKEQGKGTGLGLSTVYGIVKQSGGFVFVYSEKGAGTTIKIYLPQVEEELQPRNGLVQSGRLSRGTGTILLVEDEDSVRSLTERILTTAGYTVLPAADAGEALKLMERHGEEIRLLLTDVIMPGMSGPELAKQLTGMQPALKTVYMSGYANEAIVRHGLAEGETAFIGKPFTGVELTRIVQIAFES